MATKPQPVPWPDVVDLVDELCEWLIAAGHAVKGADPNSAAWKVLGKLKHGTDYSLPSRVARAIVDLELYRGAGRREDELQNSAQRDDLPEEARRLVGDDSTEREADRAIRALFPRFEQIRRLVEQVSERKKQRRALVPFPSELARAKEIQDQVEQTGHVLANLSLVAAATHQLYSTFQEFNPATTEYPLTLSGWRELEKAIRKGLGELDLGRKK